jgi:hypothetical protein
MYESAEESEMVTAIHLFGIEYASELEGVSINDVAELGTGHRSYGTEIRKGLRLAKYVDLKQDL